MSDAEAYVRRLDAVAERLAAHAGDSANDALTSPDATTGERWERGQVWAHLAEFVPYWIEQARFVIAAGDAGPVPFGRTKRDEGRIAAIERDRGQPASVLWSDTHAGIEELRTFLLGLDHTAWEARGLHPTLGIMSMGRIVDEFLVGHLEEHADQLDELRQAGGADEGGAPAT
ncbi:MAG TPA: hypothetical protein VFA70_01825 [Dehalococcoidia bacterium]|nr:hypothetical protein [Dehalococcoidia bacterium]